MNEIQEIDVFIQPDGTVKVEVRGVKGQKCLNLTQGFEDLLGGRVVERRYTDEFYEQTLSEEEHLELKGG